MKKNYLRNYLLTVLIVFLTGLIIFGIILFLYLKISKPVPIPPPSIPITNGNVAPIQTPGSEIDLLAGLPQKTNVLVLCTDQSNLLTDTIFVASYDKTTHMISVLSIPRDTHTVLPTEMLNEMHQDKIYPPTVMKLNAVHSYAGQKSLALGDKYSKEYISKILGINIQYTVRIDLTAFDKIVDQVGGITMTVRPQGYNYDDPTQNLHIHIPGGTQVLNGKMAEGVVRYRHDNNGNSKDNYANGDIDRIKVQHDFMKAFVAQVLNAKTLKDNALPFLSTCLNYVTTDFPITDLPKYLPCLKTLDSSNVDFETLPGYTMDNSTDYFIDPTKTAVVVNRMFYQTNLPLTPETLKTAKIQILNGSKISNYGKTIGDIMTTDGYKITSVANYNGKSTNDTIIYVRNNVDTSEMNKYFNANVNVVVDSSITGNYDIVIVLGKDEKNSTSTNSPLPSSKK